MSFLVYIIEKHQNTQLICIGPVVDLYGKFAALKLEKLATLYPGRVCLKSEASVVPPYHIFSVAPNSLSYHRAKSLSGKWP